MTIDHDELRRLCQAATPGPWFLRRNRHKTTDGRDWGWLDYQHGGANHPPGAHVTWEAGTVSHANAKLIAESRTAIPALLDELVAANERVAKLRKTMEWIVKQEPATQAFTDLSHVCECARAVLAETA